MIFIDVLHITHVKIAIMRSYGVVGIDDAKCYDVNEATNDRVIGALHMEEATFFTFSSCNQEENQELFFMWEEDFY